MPKSCTEKIILRRNINVCCSLCNVCECDWCECDLITCFPFIHFLPLLLKFVLLLDFKQLFSRTAKLFNNFPFVLWLASALLHSCCCCRYGHADSFVVDVVAFVVVDAGTSVVFADSPSFNGSPFRLTTLISTSTP